MYGLNVHCFYFEIVFNKKAVREMESTLLQVGYKALAAKMPTKRRKVDTKCRAFNKTWTAKYFISEVRDKGVYLVCGEQIAAFQDYNLSRNYQSKHAEKH